MKQLTKVFLGPPPTKTILFFLLSFFLSMQAALVFPLWKLPFWRTQQFFGSIWVGYLWPLIPYSLYDQPIPREGQKTARLELWIKPFYLPPRSIEAEDLGSRIGRFQFRALLNSALNTRNNSEASKEFIIYLERITGLKIEACWVSLFHWKYTQSKWSKEPGEHKVIFK